MKRKVMRRRMRKKKRKKNERNAGLFHRTPWYNNKILPKIFKQI